MSDAAATTVRLPMELQSRVDALAEAVGQSSSWVVERAVEAFLQEEDIRQALREADAGDFATEEEVEAAFTKWRTVSRGAG